MATATITITLPAAGPVKTRDRSFQAEYDLGVDANGVHHFAVFSCSHNKGGINYYNGSIEPNCYQASVRHETEEPRRPGQTYAMRGWTMGDGIAFAREEITRYNAKRLRAFFDAQLAALPATLIERPRVAAFFERRGA